MNEQSLKADETDGVDEQMRLASLRNLHILDTPPEEQFDRIVRVARHVVGVDVALISLIDEERQWFKAKCGLDGVSETPRSIAFCDHAIRQADILEVTDVFGDPRFADNPLVTGDFQLRYYAGAPITLSDGHRMGTVCVIDVKEREPLTDDQRAVLKDLADIAAREMEMRVAMQDMLGIIGSMGSKQTAYNPG